MGSVLGKFMAGSSLRPTVIYWDMAKGKVPNQQALEVSAPQADAVFLCVPSFAVREVAETIALFLRRGVPVITIAKGMEAATGKTMDVVLKESLSRAQPYGLLSGPMLVEELRRDKGGLAMLAVNDEKSFLLLKKLFAEAPLHLEFTTALRAVAMAGVMKNIYSIVLGVAEGLGWGNNRKGWIVAEAMVEMVALFEAWKLPKEIALGTAGLGDLIATGLSSSSRNEQVGEKLTVLQKGQSEGTESLPVIRKLARGINPRRLPLLNALWQVVKKKQTARQAFERFLK